jgi:hypothetical protein
MLPNLNPGVSSSSDRMISFTERCQAAFPCEWTSRHSLGGEPTTFLKARLNAASDS